jgi:hypothetical protein
MKDESAKEAGYSKIEVLALKRALKEGVRRCRKDKEMDACSFGYEKGILISGNDAVYILNLESESSSLRESLAASERMRMSDAHSAIHVTNSLRERVKELEEALKLARKFLSSTTHDCRSIDKALESNLTKKL